MPRDSNGNYSLPPGNPVVPQTIIETDWANPTMDDIAQALTQSLSRTGQGGMLVPFLNADGLEQTPGITWTNEPSSGWYRKSSNEFWYAVGGADVFGITAAGVLMAGGKTAPWLTQAQADELFLTLAEGDARYLQLTGGNLSGALGVSGGNPAAYPGATFAAIVGNGSSQVHVQNPSANASAGGSSLRSLYGGVYIGGFDVNLQNGTPGSESAALELWSMVDGAYVGQLVVLPTGTVQLRYQAGVSAANSVGTPFNLIRRNAADETVIGDTSIVNDVALIGNAAARFRVELPAVAKVITLPANSGGMDLNQSQDFTIANPTAPVQIDFANVRAGQRGMIWLSNANGVAITFGANILKGPGAAADLSVAGFYQCSYWAVATSAIIFTYSESLSQ